MKTWKVSINFAGYFGIEEEYEVDAETREEAEDEALEMARDDLGVIEVECINDDDDEDDEEDDG